MPLGRETALNSIPGRVVGAIKAYRLPGHQALGMSSGYSVTRLASSTAPAETIRFAWALMAFSNRFRANFRSLRRHASAFSTNNLV